MTAFAAITLADGQASPANHTFDPARIDGNRVARYTDRAVGIPLLQPRVEIAVYPAPDPTPSMKGSMLDRLASKVNIKVYVPQADDIGLNAAGYEPAQSQAYACAFNGTFTLPSRSTLASRKDILAYVANLLGKNEVKNAVWNSEMING
jgi:hypothetical protein